MPLAQMAASSLTSPGKLWASQPCAQPIGCGGGMTTMSMQDIAKKLNVLIQKWPGLGSDDQAVTPNGAQGGTPTVAQGTSPAVAQGASPPFVQSAAHTTLQPGWQPSAVSLR